MDRGPLQPPEARDDSLWQTAILLGLLWLAMVAGSVGPYLLDFDSGNYVLGVLHYDVAHHQPHPPGYPLWILAAKGLTWLVGDPRVALILEAALFVAAALVCFFLLARRRLGGWGALLGTACLAFAPPVLLYSSVAASYAVDLFASCLLGWLVASVLEGDDARVVPALAAGAVLAGFRPTAAMFLSPLLAAAMVAAFLRKSYRNLLVGLAVAGLLGAAWVFPTAHLIGGIGPWRQLTRELWSSTLPYYSVFYGAPRSVYWNMVESFFVQLALALAAIGLCLVVWWVRAFRGTAPRAADAAPPWDAWWFYLLWVTPCALSDLLFLYPKPGYQLLLLPPCFLIAAKLLRNALAHGTAALARKRAYFLTATAAAAFSLVLGYAPLPDSVYRQPWASLIAWTSVARPALAHVIARGHDELQGIFADRPDRDAILAFPAEVLALNWRMMSVDFPHLLILAVVDRDLKLFRGPVSLPDTVLPKSLRAIYWIGWPPLVLQEVRQIFPQTEFVLSNSLYSVWRSQLPAGPIDENLDWEGIRIRLHREADPAAAPRQQTQGPRVELGSGFGSLEPSGNGYYVWALGPAATIHVVSPPGWKDPARLRFSVAAAFPRVAATVLVNGKPNASIPRFTKEQPIEVLVPPGNPSTVTFRFDRWNGYPELLDSRDRRPMAVMFREIRLQSGSASFRLLDR